MVFNLLCLEIYFRVLIGLIFVCCLSRTLSLNKKDTFCTIIKHIISSYTMLLNYYNKSDKIFVQYNIGTHIGLLRPQCYFVTY